MNPCFRVFCRAFQLVFRVALPLLPYREPVELTGLASIPPLLAQKGITGVLLVTDRGVRSLGLTGPLETALAAQHIACAVYDGVVQNPTIDNVEAGRALYLSSGAQAIIAVGGGSAMDCAKAAAAKKLAKLSRLCGVSAQADGDAQAAKAFIAWIRGMNEAMRIPTAIPEIREADIPQMARHAAQESNPLYPVPKLMSAASLRPCITG